jgi:hypothetical protein
MSAPDGHKIRPTYTELSTQRATVAIGGIVETDVLSFTGFGEVVFGEFRFTTVTANVSLNDVVRLYVDGNTILEHLVGRFVEEFVPATISPLIPRRFRQMNLFIIGLKMGFLFARSLRLSYQKANAGDMNCYVNWNIASYTPL